MSASHENIESEWYHWAQDMRDEYDALEARLINLEDYVLARKKEHYQ